MAVEFHWAYSVSGAAMVKVLPVPKLVPFPLAVVFQPAKVKLPDLLRPPVLPSTVTVAPTV